MGNPFIFELDAMLFKDDTPLKFKSSPMKHGCLVPAIRLSFGS